MMDLAEKLEQKRKFADAEAIYRQVLKGDSKNEEALSSLAYNLYYLQRDPKRAEALLAEATKRLPKSDFLWRTRGVNLGWLPREYKKALPYFRKAVKLDPCFDNRAALAWCLLRLGRIQAGVAEVLAIIDKATDKDDRLQLQFELYMLGDAKELDARLREIAKLLKARTVVEDADFEVLIQRAIKAGHPGELRLLEKVVSGAAKLKTLAGWDAWKKAVAPLPLPPPPPPSAKVTAFLANAKAGLAKLAKLDAKWKVFGASNHRYKLNARLSETQVDAFEKKWGQRLPEAYRRFLIELGNGGAGPSYGVFPLGMADTGHTTEPFDSWGFDLSAPFPHREPWNDEELLDEDEDAYYDAHGTGRGSIPICHHGCGIRDWLVITGPEANNVWYDGSADQLGVEPIAKGKRARTTFAEWYMDWLRKCTAELSRNRS